MNYYKHHLGDYDGHTAHLSWDEDMAYTRLMRAYYRREKPFADAEEACRLIRATAKRHRSAVNAVLSEFFTQQPDGWHNKRCDEEIAAYVNQCAVNRRVGSMGGRPKKTESVSENNRTGFNSVSENNPNHKPRTKNQITPGVAALPDWIPQEPWNNWIASRKNKPTTRALELAVAELARLRADGHDPRAVLDQSIMHGWTGLFPLKGGPQKPQRADGLAL